MRIRKGSYRRWKMHYRKAPSQRLMMMDDESAGSFTGLNDAGWLAASHWRVRTTNRDRELVWLLLEW